MKKKSLATLP